MRSYWEAIRHRLTNPDVGFWRVWKVLAHLWRHTAWCADERGRSVHCCSQPLGNAKITCIYTHTHTRLMAPFPGLPRWADIRKVKPIWILLKQETVSGSGISWAVCKSAPRSIQTTTPAPHRSVFYRPDALPVAQPTASKHWRHWMPKSPVHNQYTMLYNTNSFLCTYLFLVLVIFITVLFLAPPAGWSWPSVSTWAHVNIPYCTVSCH